MSPRHRLPWLALALVACGRDVGTSPRVPSAPRAADPTGFGVAREQRPRLVVVIVLDQLPAWALAKYLPALSEGGAIRRGIREGAHYRVSFPYATTFTGPGHASLFTGATPRNHGITGNHFYDRAAKAFAPSVADPRYPVVGNPKATASPMRLRLPTVGDALEESTSGAAMVASLSIKDRAAVLQGGHRADLVVWHDPAVAGFTTSTYYADRLPDWLTKWHADNPVSTRLEPWKPLDPELLARYAGRDADPGEGDWGGFGTTFPHDPTGTKVGPAAIRALPAGTEYLLDLALETVERLALGADSVPDLLAISISGTDYIGHVFGPESWEYLDNLVRVDRALGAFTKAIAERTDAAFLVTSDHGVAPLPESRLADGRPAGRLFNDELREVAERRLDASFGANEWIEAIDLPFLYLTEHARAPDRRTGVMTQVTDALSALPGVFAVVDFASLSGAETDPLRSMVAESGDESLDADGFIVPSEGFVMDPGVLPGQGTNHGTPWPYDREVFVTTWGASVRRTSDETIHSALAVAPTIAKLLGIRPPPGAREAPLPAVARIRRDAR